MIYRKGRTLIKWQPDSDCWHIWVTGKLAPGRGRIIGNPINHVITLLGGKLRVSKIIVFMVLGNENAIYTVSDLLPILKKYQFQFSQSLHLT